MKSKPKKPRLILSGYLYLLFAVIKCEQSSVDMLSELVIL